MIRIISLVAVFSLVAPGYNAYAEKTPPSGWQIRGNGLIMERIADEEPKESFQLAEMSTEDEIFQKEVVASKVNSHDLKQAIVDVLAETYPKPDVFNLENVSVSYENSSIKQPVAS